MRDKSLQQIEELLERHRGVLEERLDEQAARSGSPGDPASPTPVVTAAAGDAPSVLAFDALRQSIETLRTGNYVHQAHLALIHRALLRAGGPKAPLLLVSDLLRQVGVRVESDVAHREAFTDHDGGDAGESPEAYELIDPAYLDELSGRVIQQGVITRRAEVSA